MPVTVVPYSIKEFAEQLRAKSEATHELITAKLSAKYFEDYFSTVGVRTIVVEDPYIDHDYLDDFAAYYVRCFHPYKRHCTRLHFFAESFDEPRFWEAVRVPDGRGAADLVESYRGFVVVRPLPQSVIGRTALAHYESDNGRRHFTTMIELSCQSVRS